MLRREATVHVSAANVQTQRGGSEPGQQQLAAEPFGGLTGNLWLLSKVKQSERHPVAAGGSGRRGARGRTGRDGEGRGVPSDGGHTVHQQRKYELSGQAR